MDKTMTDSKQTSGFPPPGSVEARRIGAINWRGLWTMYLKESHRFMKVWMQTLAAPAVTTLLFMVIFSVALGAGREVHGIDFSRFLAPGLMIMAMLQNAFANTTSSILIGNQQLVSLSIVREPCDLIALGGPSRRTIGGARTTRQVASASLFNRDSEDLSPSFEKRALAGGTGHQRQCA